MQTMLAGSWRVLVGFVLVGCGSVSASKPDASGGGDGAVDSAIDAPPKDCTVTQCTNNVREVCGNDGKVTLTEVCDLGCYDDMRCKLLTPSNGLNSNLDQSASQADITLVAGATIDTDTGTVMSGGAAVAVASATVTQPSGPTMRVLMAKTWTIDDLRVTGTMPLALVSAGNITIKGVIDVSADTSTGGAGAQACTGSGAGGNPGAGYFTNVPAGNSGGYPQYLWNIGGGGGGGFGSVGGTGGSTSGGTSAGGTGGGTNGVATLIPLRGGCPGYAAIGSYSGAGGGAIALVTNKTVRLVDGGGSKKGSIHVGGGSGHSGTLGKPTTGDTTPMYGPGGGGSGGGILIEAGKLVLDAGTSLLAAGGGAGGYGACSPVPSGTDAPATAATPTGGSCVAGTTPTAAGGDGATTTTGGTGANSTQGSAGGGGGGLGRIRINTVDAQYTMGNGSLVRGSSTTGTAVTH